MMAPTQSIPADPSMRALFVGHGPSFKRGVRLDPFDNVDVYPCWRG